VSAPRFAYAYRELALFAADIRKQRADGDPAKVLDGTFTEQEAADRLRIATAIATDWEHYAGMALPPTNLATQDEKLTMLHSALSGAVARRDRARQAIVAEYGERFFVRSYFELWALVDMHDTTTAHVLPYLHWESYAAALEAMLWWQTRTGTDSIRFLTRINIEWRAGRLDQVSPAA
jgi:hypothetical protein